MILYKKTLKVDPAERGHLLANDEAITKYHDKSSRQGRTNPNDYVKTDFHFLCFTMVDSYLYELDGTRKFPINHGKTTRQQMVQHAAKVIHTNFIDKTPGEQFFSILTLGPVQGSEPLPEELGINSNLNDNEIDIAKVQELVSMGFPEESVRTALKLRNNNTQQALDYLINGDREPEAKNSKSESEKEGIIKSIMELGFNKDMIITALEQSNWNMEDAVALLFG